MATKRGGGTVAATTNVFWTWQNLARVHGGWADHALWTGSPDM